MRGTACLRARASGFGLLDILYPHLANVDCADRCALNIFVFLSRCGFDQILLQEEGNDSGVGEISSLMIFYPPLQLYADQLPRVDWLLGEESWEPRVVQESELVEVTPFMCHQAGVDIV